MAGPQKSVVAALLVVVLLLFLVRRLSTPARTIVFLRTKLQALPSSDPVEHSRTVRSRPLSSLPLQSALPPLPPQLRRRPPPPPPPPPCTRLECTTKLQSLEPDWVQLSSQPRIDWAGGGVRGDCIVGEYDYMMKSPYCTPPGLPTPTGKKWPSPERLEAADVHSKHLPQCDLADVAALLPDRTFMLMGDSVMEQFYNALQCQLRREGLEKPPDPAFRRFITQNEPLWKMGKRKMPPKLPQQASSGMRMLFARAINYQPEDLAAALQTANVIVLNWGLHYHNMTQYRIDLHTAFEQLNRHASVRGNIVLFMETGAQHFRQDDSRGFGRLRASAGSWEMRDPSADKHCACSPIEDFGVNRQNGVLHAVLATGLYPSVQVLPFYELTRPRWRWHFGNCTHRPSGWNKDTCCDCSHFCYSPAMWRAHLAQVMSRLVA